MFKHMWKGGITQFLPFMVTIIGVVGLDLLKGVSIGLIISIIFILRQNIRIPYYYQRSTFSDSDLIKLTLAQEVSFLNKASIKETLNNLPRYSNVIIDAGETEYIDFDVLDLIKEFQANGAKDKSISLSLVGFRNIYKVPSVSEVGELVKPLLDRNEIPQRTAGSYKKLLNQLSQNKIENNAKPI